MLQGRLRQEYWDQFLRGLRVQVPSGSVVNHPEVQNKERVMKQSHDSSARLTVSPFLKRSVLFLFIILLVPSVAGTQVLLKGPWLLYSGSNTRMDVLWQNDS